MKILKIYGIAFLALFLSSSVIFMPNLFLSSQEQDVPVYSKSSAREIARVLKEKGILHFSLPFRVLAKLTRADRKLKAGLYRLSPRMSLWGILTTLSSGKTQLLLLKIPEGYTTEQIAQQLEKMNVVSGVEFLHAAQNRELLKKLGIMGPSAEGYLFPETYCVPLGAGADALVELMVRQFDSYIGDDFEQRCRELGLSPYQMVVLASIIEKEAKIDSERPIVAGVLYNRLHKKMRLQVNATLNYVLTTKRAWLTNEQLGTQSPYNTYLHRGLPPTPICNPGLESLEAAIHPADTPYLYYVAQGDGSSLFATTIEEHQKNVREAKTIRRAKKRRLQAAGQN